MSSLPELFILISAVVAITLRALPYLLKSHANSLNSNNHMPEFEDQDDIATICPTPDPFARGSVDSFADYSDLSLMSNDFYSDFDDPYRHNE